LSTTSGSKPAGISDSTPGSASASSSTGRITSTTRYSLHGSDYEIENNTAVTLENGVDGVTVAAMRILVTGGAGFIGSQIVDALLKDDHEVRVLDSLAAHDSIPEYLRPEAELRQADVTDADAVRAAIDGVDAVCHQAAMVGLGVDIGDIADYVRHNDLGTAVLLRELGAARFAGRFVLASSMVVYGEGTYACSGCGATPLAPPRAPRDLEAGRFDPSCPCCGAALAPKAVTESTAPDPRNVYAATKLHQEHLSFSFARETGVPVIALRYHNVYGPRMPRDTPYAGVASIFASALARGEAPRVYEDGGQLRDFVHVRDVARANVAALMSETRGAFNVASGTPRTVMQLAQALTAAAGPDAPPPVTTGDFRLGDVRHVFASARKAEAELGFKATEGFDAGMAEFARAPLRSAA
jgi:dTDP-L-rhamnose 4-epimerase